MEDSYQQSALYTYSSMTIVLELPLIYTVVLILVENTWVQAPILIKMVLEDFSNMTTLS